MAKYKVKSILGQNLILISDRALFWQEEKLLIVADLHFYKAQILRDVGIPVPEGTTAHDLGRLACLMDQFQPDKLLFLGDLIHGRTSNSVSFKQLISQWRRAYRKVQFLLVTGNHDLRAGKPPAAFRFRKVVAEMSIGPFLFTHKPKIDNSFYVIAGHLHPAVNITGKGRQKETLPCFYFNPRFAMLPAFGSFTGNQVVHPSPEDRIYVIAGDEVIEMKNDVV